MNALLSALEDHSQTARYRPALVIGRGEIWHQFTYGDLHAETRRWALGYAALGLRSGSVVFIVLPHRWELYPAFLGAMRAGLIPAFLPFPTPKQDPDLYWAQHETLFRQVRPACILTYEHNVARIAAVIHDPGCAVLDVDAMPAPAGGGLPPLSAVEKPDAVALLQYSSGTTGLKKGVALTFEQIRRQIEAYAAAIEASPQDRIVSWLPLYHDMGLIASFLLPLTVGSTIVSFDAFEWLARPDHLLTLITRHRGTLCWLPNFAFNHLVRTWDAQQQLDLSSVRAFVNCSEPCKPETFESFRATFGRHGLRADAPQTCYAMAEAVFAVTQSRMGETPRSLAVDPDALSAERRVVPVSAGHPNALTFLSCGRPIGGIRMRIDRGTSDGIGEVEIAGDFVFSNYFANPAAAEAAFKDGWYRTGDIGFLHDGELFICGRRKEMLIVHGRNYYANDIEAIAGAIAGIKAGRAVAFGAYDALTASEEATLAAETTVDGEAEFENVRRCVRKAVFDRLGLKLKQIELCAPGSLIKTTSGKLSREENARRFGGARNAWSQT